MNDLTFMLLTGTASLFSGAGLILLADPIGKGFCRLGKFLVRMKFAGFALDEGRSVAIFLSVKGVLLPTQAFDDHFAFQEQEPIKKQLKTLIECGAEVHVCPVCMKALNIQESDLIEGAQVTTKPKLFAHIGGDTAVFTY